MKKSSSSSTTTGRRDMMRLSLVLFIFMLLSHIVLSAANGSEYGEEENKEQQSIVKTITRIFGKGFPPSSWELIRTAVYKIHTKLFPPNLDFRGVKEEIGTDGAKEKVTEAAKRSLGSGKETVEETAKLAADVIGEAVHKTAETVKKATNGREVYHDDL